MSPQVAVWSEFYLCLFFFFKISQWALILSRFLMFMFSCCSVFSRCFCFSLSVLNLFPGLESSPNSLPDGFCEVLLGKEKVSCPLRDPGPMLLVWPAGDPRAQSLPEQQDGGSLAPCPGFCPVGMGFRTPMPCFAWAELTDARRDPSRLMEYCWPHHETLREPPALPRKFFGEGWWFSSTAGMELKPAGLPSAWKSSLSWGRAGKASDVLDSKT